MLFEILPDALLDAVLDTLKILPFLFLAYLLIEVASPLLRQTSLLTA